MLKPIDIKFLKQSIVLYSYYNDLGKKIYKEPQTISNVRIDQDHNLSGNLDRDADLFRNIIVIDRVNSIYNSFDDFTLDSKVVIDGHSYIIKGVKKCTDFGSDEIHHLEVTCE